MPIRAQPFKISYSAVNSGTLAPVSGDQANHTLLLIRDGVESAPTNTPTSLGAGEYAVQLTSAEMDAEFVKIKGTSATAGVVLMPAQVETTQGTLGVPSYPSLPPAPSGTAPVFEYVPVLNDTAKSITRIVSITGLSTIHGSTQSDRGRLYGRLTYSGGNYTLDLYADRARTSGRRVLSGTAGSLQSYFDLAAVNSSGLLGQAWIDSYAADDATIVAVPTFATDQDVMVDVGKCAQLPGYNSSYGLAYLHVEAVRQLLCSDLPAAVPHLFASKTGLAPVVPGVADPAMPDLRQMVNIDHLRVAQSALTKLLASRESEYTAQWADVLKLELERYGSIMKTLAAANVKETEAAAVESSTLSVSLGSFSRR